MYTYIYIYIIHIQTCVVFNASSPIRGSQAPGPGGFVTAPPRSLWVRVTI